MKLKLRIWISLLVAACMTTSCVAYEPVPYGSGWSNYDRSWSTALGVLQDAGVTLTRVDRENGVILGTSNGTEVRATVVTEADGTVRVEFESKGSTRSDLQLSNRFTQAYHQRFGQ